MSSESLRARCDTADDLAAATLKFKDRVRDDATEVTSTVAALFALSATLLELEKVCRRPENAALARYYYHDQADLVESLEYTFADIQRWYGSVEQPHFVSYKERYRTAWKNMQGFFMEESETPLLRRLDLYKEAFTLLTMIVDRQRRFDARAEDLFRSFKKLLDKQTDELADDLDNLQLTASRQKSWERKRPGPATKPKVPPLDPSSRHRKRSASRKRRSSRAGYASPVSSDLDDWVSLSPLPAPEPPLYVPSSPSTTTVTSASTSSSTRAPIVVGPLDHWLPAAFGQSRPTTVFSVTGSESGCFGENQSGASHKLKLDHDELLSLPFESNYLELRFYHRSHDRRARIWCRMDRGGRKSQCVQNVTSLRIQRKESCLQLCKPDSGNMKLHLWANLKFTSYERMVLFYCSFLALKAQDEASPVSKLDDHVLHGEKYIWGAKILDDNYQHALQIFKDENSGGIRLQASILRGSMKTCPVWTAFITYKVQARAWIYRYEEKKVNLLELQRYIFSYEYKPQLGPNGEEQLHFLEAEDADAFMDVIEDLGEGLL